MIPTASELANEYTGSISDSVRSQLRQLFFSSGSLPSGIPVDTAGLLAYTIALPGTDYLQQMQFHPQTGTANGKLVIIAHGHDGNGANRDTDYTAYTTGAEGNLLALGYDILEVWMLGIKYLPDYGDISNPFGSATSSPYHGDHHHSLGSNVWRYHLEHIIAAINYYAASYDSIIMMGKSGGAWLSVLCAALDERIKLSVPICGTCPRYLSRKQANSAALSTWRIDSEQYSSELYSIASITDLYALGCSSGRQQQQYLNSNDIVEPFNYAADYVSDWAGFLQGKGFNFDAISVAGSAAHYIPSGIWTTLHPILAAI